MTHSVCVCSTHQNVVLPVDAMEWDVTNKDLIKKIVHNSESNKYVCIGVNPVLALQLWKNFLIGNSTSMKMMRNLITASGTLRIEQYWQTLQPLTKNTQRHRERKGLQPPPPPPHHFLEQNLFFHVKLENIKFLNVKNGLAFIYWTIHNWQKVDSFFWICRFSSKVSYHSYQQLTKSS